MAISVIDSKIKELSKSDEGLIFLLESFKLELIKQQRSLYEIVCLSRQKYDENSQMDINPQDLDDEKIKKAQRKKNRKHAKKLNDVKECIEEIKKEVIHNNGFMY